MLGVYKGNQLNIFNNARKSLRGLLKVGLELILKTSVSSAFILEQPFKGTITDFRKQIIKLNKKYINYLKPYLGKMITLISEKILKEHRLVWYIGV